MAGSERIGRVCDTPCAAAGRPAGVGDAGLWVGGGAMGAAAAAAAAAKPRTVTISPPGPILPPLATCTFSTTPLAVDGTSMVALSVSSVTRGASKSTLSPALTMTSMTETESKLPMSGTRTSMEVSFAGAGAGAGAAAAAAGFDSAGRSVLAAGADADDSPFKVTTSAPAATLPPLVTCTCSTTPFAVEGISIVALSVSSVASGVSMSMLSPGFTSTSMTDTESKFPMSGTRTSTVLMLSADPAC
jgi:hypothetical protein